jgi:hypothetical protein
MSRQLALGGQPVLVARWSEAASVVQEHPHLNRLLLVEARLDTPGLAPLVTAAAARGCALLVVLGPEAKHVLQGVEDACGLAAPGKRLATSWHDSAQDADAALDAFSLFSTWVGGSGGIPLLVTEDEGLDAILEAARLLHARTH